VSVKLRLGLGSGWVRYLASVASPSPRASSSSGMLNIRSDRTFVSLADRKWFITHIEFSASNSITCLLGSVGLKMGYTGRDGEDEGKEEEQEKEEVGGEEADKGHEEDVALTVEEVALV
jgi:hypothetical protein